MLTNCGCIANKEQTEILLSCPLHELWYLKRERARLEKLSALLNAGERTINEAFKAASSAETPR